VGRRRFGIICAGWWGTRLPMQRAYELARMVAVRDTTVLVTGESGTGKDLVAQEIHQISPRRRSSRSWW
jgi:transcriptional regulator with PAS, ATPase and Fis domain